MVYWEFNLHPAVSEIYFVLNWEWRFLQLPRLKISLEQLTPELRDLIGACDVLIEVTPCTESAHTFNVIDYRDSVTNDLARQDRSFRQFFEILTNNSALQKWVLLHRYVKQYFFL